MARRRAGRATAPADRGDAIGGRQRTCAGCRARRPAEELIRFVIGPDGALLADTGRRPHPGRGAWLCPRPGCATRAHRRGGLARTLRGAVRVDQQALHDLLRGALRDRAVQAVRSAMRAGVIGPSDGAALLAALGRDPDGRVDEEELEAVAARLRDSGAAGDPVGGPARGPTSGVTGLEWNARILRRFGRLRAYLDAERGRPEPTPVSGRRQRRGDVK